MADADIESVQAQKGRMTVSGVVEAVVDAIAKYSWRSMFGVCVASGALIFFSKKFGVFEWEHPLHGWFIGAFIVSGGVLLTYVGSAVHPWIGAHFADWGMILRGRKHLGNLSNDEKERCTWFMGTNGSSLHHNEADGALGSLIEKNIVFTPGQPWQNGMRDFRIQPWALRYLKKHPKLLK